MKLHTPSSLILYTLTRSDQGVIVTSARPVPIVKVSTPGE